MDNFLSDYGALIAPIAAIINGFIAVVVAQFYKDHIVAKVVLVAAAGILGFVAVTATILNQRQIVAAKATDRVRQEEIREALGGFVKESLSLVKDCGDSSVPPRWKELADWQSRVSTFLRERLGESYVTRLTSPAGVPLNVSCRGADEAHNNIYRVVNAMNYRLDQFISEQMGLASR